jgi:signal transduction histidine kinase
MLGLRPQDIDLGLERAIENAAEQMEECGFEVSLSSNLAGRRFAEMVEICFCRICQEACKNISKHAGPCSVHIELNVTSSELRLTVCDTGRGFDVNERRALRGSSSGFGLVGMRERIICLGGTFSLFSAHGAGTTVDIRLPMDE